MLVFLGHASYIISFFFFSKGFKLVLGIGYIKFFRRFFLILAGITLINLFMALIDVKNYEVGLIAVFLFDLIFQVYQEQIKNYIILYFGGSLIFLVGILAIMYGLNIKIKLITIYIHFLMLNMKLYSHL